MDINKARHHDTQWYLEDISGTWHSLLNSKHFIFEVADPSAISSATMSNLEGISFYCRVIENGRLSVTLEDKGSMDPYFPKCPFLASCVSMMVGRHVQMSALSWTCYLIFKALVYSQMRVSDRRIRETCMWSSLWADIILVRDFFLSTSPCSNLPSRPIKISSRSSLMHDH